MQDIYYSSKLQCKGRTMILEIPIGISDELNSFLQSLVLLVESQERAIEELRSELADISSNLKN